MAEDDRTTTGHQRQSSPNVKVRVEDQYGSKIVKNDHYISKSFDGRGRGPRSLYIERSEYGFGFTLRHFIVYPPESTTILSRDRRLGLRGDGGEGPMDTIFVKSVRPGSPAALAGLNTGDRVISVNGETTATRTYAEVVHLIQHSHQYLHLLVVPKEEDILQRYFGDTAHNPETNLGPGGGGGGRVRTGSSGDMVGIRGGVSPQRRSSPAGPGSALSSPPYQPPPPLLRPSTHLDSSRGSLYGSGSLGSKGPVSLDSSSEFGDGSYSLPPGGSSVRLSLDVGSVLQREPSSSREGSASSLHSSDDSVIIDRIRRSFERKEEFLRRPPEPLWSSTPPPSLGHLNNDHRSSSSTSSVREFYSQPGKLQAPVWPPAIPASSVPPAKPPSPEPLPPPGVGGFVCGGPVTNPPSGGAGLDRGRAPLIRLGRIQETGPVNRIDSPPPPPLQSNLKIVSQRAKEFETGQCQPNRTGFYTSELARLGAKQSVPNVAVRRREFETRASDWRAHRESRSLDSTSSTTSNSSVLNTVATSGNRITPVGSNKLHCDPPKDYRESSPDNDSSQRPRSNSLEAALMDDSNSPQRHKAVRQDSYLAAVKKPVSSDPEMADNEEGKKSDGSKTGKQSLPTIRLEVPSPEKSGKSKPVRPSKLDLSLIIRPSNKARGESPIVTPDGDSTPQSSPGLDTVVRRKKILNKDSASEDERSTRRESYLKATWGDRMHVDTDLELSDSEPSAHRRFVRKWRPPLFPNDIQRLRRMFEQLINDSGSNCRLLSQYCDKEVTLEGSLNCKIAQIDGKKAHDRSWKMVWAVLRSPVLFLFKDKKDAASETPVDHERIDLRSGSVSAADDYSKRRHVIRLSTPSSSEILLQADSAADMAKWLQALQTDNNQNVTSPSATNLSPAASHKGNKALSNFRNLSPSPGHTSASKGRKPSQSEGGQASPKAPKTWKSRTWVAEQIRRIQPGSRSPVSPTTPVSYPKGATINIPLDLCPPSPNNEYIPLLVELCTGIVEDKGLEIIGIYRVPGNTAAVSSLTEAVNRGMDSALMDQDQRWSDVNVISSLLKSFFRKLPDCLLTTELYPRFIQANKIEDPRLRIATLRELVQELPPHNYHTLKHLLKHLKLVVDHSGVNKMEARNLAIVFGPTLIRAGDDNMVTMVTDMSHQCRIVETLILYVDWCFSDDPLESLVLKEDAEANDHVESDSAVPNQSLLLDNIHKVEGMKESPTRDLSAKDIVTSIITAANRKIQKSKTRKTVTSVISEDTPDLHSDKHRADGRGEEEDGGLKKDRVRTGSLEEVLVHPDRVHRGSIACGVKESVLFSGNIVNQLATTSVGGSEPTSSDVAPTVKLTTEDGTIRTYTGLSETTQERIRRFELETRAMLQRENFRKREMEKEKLEWSNARRDSDKDVRELSATNPAAIIDKIAGDGESKILRENSPLARWKQITSPPSGQAPDKRLKTATEVAKSNNLVRHGSLDSLKDAPSNERPHSNLSDECGDLVKLLTTTFDSKMTSVKGDVRDNAKGVKSEKESKVESKESSDQEDCLKKDKELDLEAKQSFRDPSLHRSCATSDPESKAAGKEEKVELSEKEKLEEIKDEEKENCVSCRLRRSESLNKRDEKKDNGLCGSKLRRAESLNKKGEVGDKLKRSDSLTKTEKTESNLNKRRQLEAAGKLQYKMKRKGTSQERSIKRRHTVGGTKDFDKVTWLDNRECIGGGRAEEGKERRTSSPDLSGRVLMEVTLRPLSLAEPPQYAVPLESHI